MTENIPRAELRPPLFHYTPTSTAFKILRGGQLWATGIRFLNDTAEYQHGVEMLRLAFRNRLEHQPALKLFLETAETALDTRRGGSFVASFSEDGDLLSQWTAYCPDGGFALEFSHERLAALAARPEWCLRPCIYERRDQERTVEGIVTNCVNGYGLPGSGATPRPDDYTDLREGVLEGAPRDLALLKNPFFRAEREWRILFTMKGRAGRPRDLAFRESAGGLQIPYVAIELGRPPVDVVVGAIVSPTGSAGLAAESLREVFLSLGMDRAADNIRLSKVPYRAPPR